MNLSQISNQELLARLEKLSLHERKLGTLILWHINEIDSRRLYVELGFSSLFDYLTKHLKYSESSAYRKMQAARILKSYPQIEEKIKDGSLSPSQLTSLQKYLKQETKKNPANNDPKSKKETSLPSTGPTLHEKTQGVLEKLENKSLFESEKILALEFNHEPKATQKIRPQKDHSVRLELTLTQEQYEIIKAAQSLLSHIITDNDLAEAMTYLAQSFIQKKEGKRCQSRYQLQIDHVHPLAKGGQPSRGEFAGIVRGSQSQRGSPLGTGV